MKTDILVIGSGPGGSSIASYCKEQNKKVVIVDSHFGGTCALRGCTPKKAMETISSAFWDGKKYSEVGFPKFDSYLDWHQLQTHQSKFTAQIPRKTVEKFEHNGITTVKGHAKFIDPYTVIVNDQKITADHIIIATGAHPITLDIPGADLMKTNDDFFNLSSLPKKVFIVGGGYIGFEFAHIIAACGSEVTILSSEELPLSKFDSDLVDLLIQATQEKGIDVRLGYSAQSIRKFEKHYYIETKKSNGNNQTFDCDLIIHAAGRTPNTKNLGLDTIGIDLNDQKGISINDFLQTKHGHIYAIGDVTGQMPFTETAVYEAEIVCHNLFHDQKKSLNYYGVPFAIFTHPKMAQVGLKANEMTDDHELVENDLSNSFLERTHLNDFASSKVILEKKSGIILGAAIIGSDSHSMINAIAMAIQQKMTKEQFQEFLFIYPTSIQQVKSLLS